MEAFLLGLVFKILRWVLGWLWKILRPVFGSLLRALWPLVRFLLIVVGIVAGIVLMRRFLDRNPDIIQKLKARA
jgi:hypothetical protein